MTRSARRADYHGEPGLPRLFRDALLACGATVSRNPVIVGGSTAFLVTLFYVSANAIWYQPGMHANAVFATRPMLGEAAARPAAGSEEAVPETMIRIERPEPPARPAGDPVVEGVQRALAALDIYGGAIDGIAGPQTTKAIRAYQAVIGMEATGEISDRLLAELKAGPARPTAAQAPMPAPAPRSAAQDANPNTASIPAASDERVRRVQAGLRAFGNDQVEVDGLVGPDTRAAIREFQTLFGLPVTGGIDEALVDKMREVGLTD